jgi:hypothetical protein
MENVGIFCAHLEYISAIRFLIYGHLVYFFPFWYIVSRKIWQPCLTVMRRNPFLHKVNSFPIQVCKTASEKNGKKSDFFFFFFRGRFGTTKIRRPVNSSTRIFVDQTFVNLKNMAKISPPCALDFVYPACQPAAGVR